MLNSLKKEMGGKLETDQWADNRTFVLGAIRAQQCSA